MPGMMNTILNLGLNDEAVVGLANATSNERFAYDAYRRLINMFGDVVWASITSTSKRPSTRSRSKYKAKLDNDVPLEGMIELCDELQGRLPQHVGKPFPQEPLKQLEARHRGRLQELEAAPGRHVPPGREHHRA